MTQNALLWAAIGTLFTFAMTVLGAATVFLFRNNISMKLQNILMGFAAGVMIAASVWSLLLPALEQAEAWQMPAWLPAAGGVLMGVFFLLWLDKLLPCIYGKYCCCGIITSAWKRSALMMLAVTLHNIPEGMAVGLSFALAAEKGIEDMGMFASAVALAVGIGIQNFPEGAAISLPLRQEGMQARKAFMYGCASAVVEPVFGVIVVWAAGSITALMPWLLSFAAGAMLYVVVKELIPAAQQDNAANQGTLGVMIGFVIMMLLDVALG